MVVLLEVARSQSVRLIAQAVAMRLWPSVALAVAILVLSLAELAVVFGIQVDRRLLGALMEFAGVGLAT